MIEKKRKEKKNNQENEIYSNFTWKHFYYIYKLYRANVLRKL